MPNMDGTGPSGDGPMTGRGMGPCGRGARSGRVMRRGGYGMGRGRGYGRGYGYQATDVMPYQPTKKEYIQMLKDEVKDIQSEISDLEK